MQGPDTDAQDQSPPFTHIRLATHGRSIQLGHKRRFDWPSETSGSTQAADVWIGPWQIASVADEYAQLVGFRRSLFLRAHFFTNRWVQAAFSRSVGCPSSNGLVRPCTSATGAKRTSLTSHPQ